jgi:hypothetical protein
LSWEPENSNIIVVTTHKHTSMPVTAQDTLTCPHLFISSGTNQAGITVSVIEMSKRRPREVSYLEANPRFQPGSSEVSMGHRVAQIGLCRGIRPGRASEDWSPGARPLRPLPCLPGDF